MPRSDGLAEHDDRVPPAHSCRVVVPAGEYRLVCDGCGLSISGAEGTTVAEAQRKRGLLTGLIGDHSGAFLEIISDTGDVTVRVIAG